jgi:hypothetical protein
VQNFPQVIIYMAELQMFHCALCTDKIARFSIVPRMHMFITHKSPDTHISAIMFVNWCDELNMESLNILFQNSCDIQ